MEDAIADTAAEPADALLAQELGDTLDQAVLALPDSLRAAFVVREIEGLSTRDAAAALSISEPALKVRLHRARLALRNSLSGYRPVEERPLPESVERRLLDSVCP